MVTAAAALGGDVVFRRESGIARGATASAYRRLLAVHPGQWEHGITNSTDFTWNLDWRSPPRHFNGPGNTSSYYVVTAEASTRSPISPWLPSCSFPVLWFVESPFASVDDYTGTGFLLPPVGSVEGSISEPSRITTQ